VYVLLEPGVLEKLFETDQTLLSGETYSFKVKSRNSVGYSEFSEVVSILAAREPDQILVFSNVPG